MILNGKALAARLRADVAAAVTERVAAGARAPALAVVLVGDNPASTVYVRNKIAACEAAGIRSVRHQLPGSASQAALIDCVEALNRDAAIDGILVQLPLPSQMDAQAVIAAIDPAKDVDGFHPVNAGRLATGLPGFVPCTPLGCLRLIDTVHADIAGAEAVVVGRSTIVGRPMAQLLLQRSATVTVAHSRSRDLAEITRRADILVVAVGRPELVRGSWIRPGATVIDVGINRIQRESGEGSRLVGDVAFDEAAAVAAHITPVPGGVGPMTIACLLQNTLAAAAGAGTP